MRAFFLNGLVALSVGAVAGCEVEPSKSEILRKEADEAAKAGAKRGAVSPDPMHPSNKVNIDVFSPTKRASIEAERGNDAGAMVHLETALLENPKDREALRLMARCCQRRATSLKRPDNTPYFLKSAEAMRTLRAEYPDLTKDELEHLPLVYYNEACTLAYNGEGDRALKALNDAFEAGFDQVDVLDTDDELDSLRQRPDFQAIVDKIESAHADKLLSTREWFKFDFQLPNLDGKVVKLGDFKGKVLVVDFWGTWCPPCRKQIPHLIEVDKRFRDKNAAVVGINYEKEEGEVGKGAVASFVKEFAIPYPCLVGDEATRKQVFGFKGFPTTLFIGSDGKVRLKLDGYQKLSTLEIILAKILEEEAKALAK